MLRRHANMNDLELHRVLLAHPRAEAAATTLGQEVGDALRALAARQLRERFAHLGALGPALADPDETIRAAALAALAGARGRTAFTSLASALDDPSALVRKSAVEALAASCANTPARWALAVFHPDVSVRRAVLAHPAPIGCTDLAFHLRADEATRDAAPPLPGTVWSVATVLRFVQRGFVDGASACSWLASQRTRDIAAVLESMAPRRSHETLIAALEGRGCLGEDSLDALISVLAAEANASPEKDAELPEGPEDADSPTQDEPGAPLAARADLARLLRAIFTTSKLDARPRFAAAIAAHASAGVEMPAVFWRVFAAGHPIMLVDERWTLAQRRLALDGMVDPGGAATLSDAAVDALLRSSLVRGDSGVLEPGRVAAAARLYASRPLTHALRVLGRPALVEAIMRDPPRAAPIFGPKDPARAELLAAVAREPGAPRQAFLGWTFASRTDDSLELVELLDAAALVDAVIGTADLVARGAVRMSAGRRRRLRELIGAKLHADGGLGALLAAWVGQERRASLAFVAAVVADTARRSKTSAWTQPFTDADDATLEALVPLLALLVELPWGKERALAEALARSHSGTARAWALARTAAPSVAAPRPTGVRVLTQAEERDIRTSADLAALELALDPALSSPSTGVARALAGRAAEPSASAIVALLASHDDPTSVAVQLTRYGLDASAKVDFLREVDALAVLHLRPVHTLLPAFAHAWLHCFEQHAFAWMAHVESRAGGVCAALEESLSLPCVPLLRRAWDAVARALEIWCVRDRASLTRVLSVPLLTLCLRELDGAAGEGAARVLAVAARSSLHAPFFVEHRPHLTTLAPDLSEAVRTRLADVIDVRGLLTNARARRSSEAEISAGIALARETDSLDALALLCADAREPVVHEAVLRMLARGAEGEARFVSILEADDAEIEHVTALASAVPLLETPAALARVDRLVLERRGFCRRADMRFPLASARAHTLAPGELRDRFLEAALAAACAESSSGWLRPDDVSFLAAQVEAPRVVLELLLSPHPHGYQWALDKILGGKLGTTPHAVRALRDFLSCEARDAASRMSAARSLLARGDSFGLPLLIEEYFRETLRGRKVAEPDVPDDALPWIAVSAVSGGAEMERPLLNILEKSRVGRGADEAIAHELAYGSQPASRTRARGAARTSSARGTKLRAIARTFAWGVLRGRELTGRILNIRMTDSETFGYTFIESPDVFVTPLPILRGERNGQAVVEGLILHEIGHQAFHRGPESQKVRDEATRADLFRLLNLVMDEHLERNLRAIEDAWGDSLKTLAAYAFRHSMRTFTLQTLVHMLGEHLAPVLIATPKGVAVNPHEIRIESGALMAALLTREHSFFRFVLALRMGLGNRWEDPKVERGLALFTRSFRKLDMRGLWKIALELRRIFGDEIELVLGVGGHEGVGDAGSLLGEGEGISDAELQGEVQRVLGAPEGGSGAERSGAGRPTINVAPEEAYPPITQVERVAPNPARHAEIAREVTRHAQTMRRALEALGLRLEPVGMRVRGRRFDRTRTLALVTRRDPRILIARETRLRSDLFLGLCIDCSGSMTGASMERAHRFGVMLVSAVAGLRSVDLRAFGFTERVIYDAGDARHSAVAALVASGGNNDAAALDHVVAEASRSHRRAKLVVMISDGLPTSCSVAALRGAVRRAGKKNVACAQIAVRPLAEQCFPHYVEIEGGSEHAAIARFARVVTELVRKTMGA